jgi:hypothetical protein
VSITVLAAAEAVIAVRVVVVFSPGGAARRLVFVRIGSCRCTVTVVTGHINSFSGMVTGLSWSRWRSESAVSSTLSAVASAAAGQGFVTAVVAVAAVGLCIVSPRLLGNALVSEWLCGSVVTPPLKLFALLGKCTWSCGA